MTAEQFVYWLQGFMEVADPSELDGRQTQQIKNHLKLVFDKRTPEVSLPMVQHKESFRITPYTITCDGNEMITPVCSGTTISTNVIDPVIQKAMDDFTKAQTKKSKRVKFDSLKC